MASCELTSRLFTCLIKPETWCSAGRTDTCGVSDETRWHIHTQTHTHTHLLYCLWIKKLQLSPSLLCCWQIFNFKPLRRLTDFTDMQKSQPSLGFLNEAWFNPDSDVCPLPQSTFSFEAGRRCDSGEGSFEFDTKQGNFLFQAVEAAINLQRISLPHRQTSGGGQVSPETPDLNLPPLPSIQDRMLPVPQPRSHIPQAPAAQVSSHQAYCSSECGFKIKSLF